MASTFSTTTAPPRPIPRPPTAPGRRVKVLPFVPKNLWTLFQDVCRPIFADLERAAACNNVVQLERLVKELLEVPPHTLTTRRGGRRLEATLASQLRAASIRRQHPPSALPTSTTSRDFISPQQQTTTGQSVEASVVDVDARIVRRAVGLTLSNHASRATRAIYQDALPEITPLVEDELVRLHPPATSTAIPALPINAPITPVLGDDRFVHIWKKRVANGAAPGVSGFTGDHGMPLLEDTHCLRGYHFSFNLFVTVNFHNNAALIC